MMVVQQITKHFPNHTFKQGDIEQRRGRQGFRTLCCDVFGLVKNQFLRNNNKGSRSNANKHELVNCECTVVLNLVNKIEKVKDFNFIRKGSLLQRYFQSNSRLSCPGPLDVCLPFVLLFTIFIIVVTQKLISIFKIIYLPFMKIKAELFNCILVIAPTCKGIHDSSLLICLIVFSSLYSLSPCFIFID